MRAHLYFVGAIALTAMVASSACVKSGDIGATLADGGSSTSRACVFDELDTFTCPGLSLAPPVWVGKCVDNDDCTRRVNGTTTTAGCHQATAYTNVQALATSCASWGRDGGGGTIPIVDSGPPPVCAPDAVAGFKPRWRPPRAKTTACTKSQIDAYLQCLTDARTTLSPASCAEWSGTLSATDQACLTCLSSNESDATYGPLVLLPTELLINVAGCIALAEGKTDGTGCGGALQADQQCQRAACLPSCPTASSASLKAEEQCEALAGTPPGDGGGGGVCATFATPAECAGAIEHLDAGSSAERQCFGAAAGVASSQFEAVALAFCGP